MIDEATTLIFVYSKEHQKLPNEGPLPEGLYSINKSGFKPGENENGLQKWSDLSLAQKIASYWGGGSWGGGNGKSSWGSYRWRLKEENVDTYGRKGFFLHGGSKWGSKGCIDTGNGIGTVVNAILTNKTGNDKVYIQAIYPKDLQLTVANNPTNQLEKK